MKIGKLQEVEVRELWSHEQYDFSNWLAKYENLEYLNEILGLTLTDVNREVFVGSYRCDLVARDDLTDTKVIIENQLEQSNHDHLGKIITYASGLDANVIVWIVKEARDEHKAAVEWLNNNTNKNINFFLIELHAYKIGDSLPAPKFEVVEMPNDFIKNSKYENQNKDDNLNKSQANRLEFWTKFNEVVIEKGKPFSIRKATTDHWYNISLGTSQAHIGLDLVNKDRAAVVEVYISDNKQMFDELFMYKDEIEKELGFSFIWDRLDNKKASRIKHYIYGLDFDDHSNYSELMSEMIQKAVSIRTVFKKYIS